MKYKKIICVKQDTKTLRLELNKQYLVAIHRWYSDKPLTVFDDDFNFVGIFNIRYFKSLD